MRLINEGLNLIHNGGIQNEEENFKLFISTFHADDLCHSGLCRGRQDRNLQQRPVSQRGGQEITVPVSVRGNAGFDNFVIELEYDPNVLTPTDEPAVPGELLTVVPEVEKTPGEIIFSASQAVSADGQLFTYKFKVNESVTTRVVSPIIINVKELSITTDGDKSPCGK